MRKIVDFTKSKNLERSHLFSLTYSDYNQNFRHHDLRSTLKFVAYPNKIKNGTKWKIIKYAKILIIQPLTTKVVINSLHNGHYPTDMGRGEERLTF